MRDVVLDAILAEKYAAPVHVAVVAPSSEMRGNLMWLVEREAEGELFSAVSDIYRDEPPAFIEAAPTGYIEEHKAGPWAAEPSGRFWLCPFTGYLCAVMRSHMGSLCGYVFLPRNHVWSKGEGWSINACVHGGVTFTSLDDITAFVKRLGFESVMSKADFAALGAIASLGTQFVVGFDCSHAGDLVPALDASGLAVGSVYRNMEFVTEEVAGLAAQAGVAAHE